MARQKHDPKAQSTKTYKTGIGQAAQRTHNLGAKNKELNSRQQDINETFVTRQLQTQNPFNNPSRDNYQTYPYDYYAGSDCKIFFGDIWVDDIITISYDQVQTKTPIYGYASQLFDAVAKGTVIVNGSFAIAFKEVGYLNIIFDMIKAQRDASEQALQNYINQYNTKEKQNKLKFDPRIAELSNKGVASFNAQGQPDIIRRNETIEDILVNKKISNKFSDSIAKDFRGSGDRDFEDFAELLEDTIWGDTNGSPYTVGSQKYQIRRPDEFDYNNKGGIEVGYEDHNGVSNYSKTMNVLLTFGDLNDQRAEHTLVALNDIHITGKSMIVSPTGDPIAEQYQFFARDTNRTIGQKQFKAAAIPNHPANASTMDDINKIESALKTADSTISDVEVNVLKGYNSDSNTWETYEGTKTKWTIHSNNQAIDDFINGNYSQRLEDYEDQIDKYGEKSDKWNEKLKKERYKFNTTGINSDGSLETFSERGTNRANRKIAKYNKKQTGVTNSRNQYTESIFAINSSEPLIDQLIRIVEDNFNNLELQIAVQNKEIKQTPTTPQSRITEKYSQLNISVKFNTSDNESKNINMVLDQVIPRGNKYKVIAPTRNNFTRVNTFSRDDLWKDIDPNLAREKADALAKRKTKANTPEETTVANKPSTDVVTKKASDAVKADATSMGVKKAEAFVEPQETTTPGSQFGLTNDAQPYIQTEKYSPVGMVVPPTPNDNTYVDLNANFSAPKTPFTIDIGEGSNNQFDFNAKFFDFGETSELNDTPSFDVDLKVKPEPGTAYYNYLASKGEIDEAPKYIPTTNIIGDPNANITKYDQYVAILDENNTSDLDISKGAIKEVNNQSNSSFLAGTSQSESASAAVSEVNKNNTSISSFHEIGETYTLADGTKAVRTTDKAGLDIVDANERGQVTLYATDALKGAVVSTPSASEGNTNNITYVTTAADANGDRARFRLYHSDTNSDINNTTINTPGIAIASSQGAGATDKNGKQVVGHLDITLDVIGKDGSVTKVVNERALLEAYTKYWTNGKVDIRDNVTHYPEELKNTPFYPTTR